MTATGKPESSSGIDGARMGHLNHWGEAMVQVRGPMLETVCAENNGDFFNQNLFLQPEAKMPDF